MKLSPRTSVIILLGLLAVIIAGVLPGSVYRRVYNLTLGRFFRHTVESRLESFSAEAPDAQAVAYTKAPHVPMQYDAETAELIKKFLLTGKF